MCTLVFISVVRFVTDLQLQGWAQSSRSAGLTSDDISAKVVLREASSFPYVAA